LAKRKTRAFLVIRNDKMVYEWYADGVTPERKQGTASLAKALVGGLSLAVAITDGRIALDDKAARFVRKWNEDPQKARITIRHLGSHTSGLADAEQNRLPHDKLLGWQGDFWKRLDPPNDPFTLARDRTPVLFEPGARLSYSNPGFAMLSYVVTASLTNGPQKDLRTLLRDRVMRPMGVADADWSIGYGQTSGVDGLRLVASWGGGSFTPRATARIGRLLLRQGDWDGITILSKEAVRQITGDAGLPGRCGMGFWTNAGGRYPNVPTDAYYGAGAGDQLLIVVPCLNLIAVRHGEALAPEPKDAPDVFAAFHDQRAKILFEPLIDAIADRPRQSRVVPYPPSKHITGIRWAPKDTIIRKARDSDNWPLTWADDDHLYTAYGDGRGFEPFLPIKLGMGIARVEGSAVDFVGRNIRAPTVESRGQGSAGKKASGMLCVDGVLYLWARNAGNAQLAWSLDRGKTWKWADWKLTTSFGCPTFLNFGKNYAGARDQYVYIYSHDADSAYQPADRMVLARVPKGKIKERDAYEFFQGLDGQHQPRWTKAIAERGAVFKHAGRCYRSGITYNPGLGRYLWVQIIPGTEGLKTDTRFEGGFGIYDAPEPWGPWTTAYFTEKWDVGPGETASFPSKWVSPDGKTLQLVFSGDDHFAVRRATLTTAQQPPPDLEFIDTSFENASPLWYETDPEGTVQLYLNYDHERSSPNRAAGHFHFQVCARPGAKLTLEFKNLDNVWNGRKASIASEMKITFVSVDGRAWAAVPTRALPGNRVLLDLPMPGPKVYVSRVEPYRLSDLDRLLASIRKHPRVAITPIGKTVEGRELEIIRIGNPRAPYRVFLRARAHPWEAGSNWVVQGLIQRLLKDDADAARYLERYCAYILPMANKDGVARGRTRFNLKGMDLNRNWDKPADRELAPENHALELWLETMIGKGERPHLALELHNDGNGQLHLSRPPGINIDGYLSRMITFEKLLRQHTWFTEGSTRPTFRNIGTLGEGWLERYGIDAVVHEFNCQWIAGLKDYPNGRHWETYGEQLARVFYDYLDGLR
jgi:CubicO group peptidase (beta-lactamase class C family)